MDFYRKKREFNDIYQKIYVECNEELENLRAKAKKEKVINLILGVIFTIAFLVFLASSPKTETPHRYDAQARIAFIVSYIVIVIISILKNMFLSGQKKYNKIFKEKVIKRLINLCDESLKYRPRSPIGPHIYISAEFEPYCGIKSEDKIYGTLKSGFKMELADIHVIGDIVNPTIFRGLFGQVEINTIIQCKVYARRNNKINKFIDTNKVEMDSEEFEKLYDVYCDNKIIAMQIFTAEVMQMFVDMQELEPEITIKADKLYIRFKTGNIFEGNIFRDSLDYDTLKNYYDIMLFSFSIAESIAKSIEQTGI